MLQHGRLTLPVLHRGTGASWGGIAGGVVALWLELQRRPGLAAAFACALLPAIPLAQALGRLGCFAAGCDHGSPAEVPWSVTYGPESSVSAGFAGTPLHPVQLYEALLCLGIAAWLWRRLDPSWAAARQIGLYLTLYAAGRFAVELFRGDAGRGIPALGLSTAQLLAVAWLASRALYGAWSRRLRGASPGVRASCPTP
jgi:phosphatidylglycerol:prolipoprotein diacylglycerol transferase